MVHIILQKEGHSVIGDILRQRDDAQDAQLVTLGVKPFSIVFYYQCITFSNIVYFAALIDITATDICSAIFVILNVTEVMNVNNHDNTTFHLTLATFTDAVPHPRLTAFTIFSMIKIYFVGLSFVKASSQVAQESFFLSTMLSFKEKSQYNKFFTFFLM